MAGRRWQAQELERWVTTGQIDPNEARELIRRRWQDGIPAEQLYNEVMANWDKYKAKDPVIVRQQTQAATKRQQEQTERFGLSQRTQDLLARSRPSTPGRRPTPLIQEMGGRAMPMQFRMKAAEAGYDPEQATKMYPEVYKAPTPPTIGQQWTREGQQYQRGRPSTQYKDFIAAKRKKAWPGLSQAEKEYELWPSKRAGSKQKVKEADKAAKRVDAEYKKAVKQFEKEYAEIKKIAQKIAEGPMPEDKDYIKAIRYLATHGVNPGAYKKYERLIKTITKERLGGWWFDKETEIIIKDAIESLRPQMPQGMQAVPVTGETIIQNLENEYTDPNYNW